MPTLITFDKQTGRKNFLKIQDVKINPDGFVEIFSIKWSDKTEHYYLYSRNDKSLLNTVSTIFGNATSLRSAHGLMQAFNKRYGNEKWNNAAGAIGVGIGSAKILYDWLKSRPHHVEGYYRSDGSLWSEGKIHKDNPDNYIPDEAPKPPSRR